MNTLTYMPSASTPTMENAQIKGSFRHFIFQKKENKKLLFIALAGAIAQFFAFKLLYPFPDFISDSYSYIDTNLYKMNVNLWPIGYSKYLWFIHQITPSHTFLIFTQYFLLEAALLYFFYSFQYLFNLSEKHVNILFVFLFFNPIFLYLSNCVLSDALFCTISLILFTQLMWMYYKPRPYQIFLQVLLIGVAFTLRYTAIYYPLTTAAAYFLSRQRLAIKLIAAISAWIFIIPFILYTQQETKKVTGTAEFSVFGGWQLANNALYMYDHINVDSTKLPKGTLELDRLVREFYKEVPPEHRVFEPFPGTYFIKVPFAVLKPYMFRHATFTDAPGQFAAWGKVSPIYNKYGTYLVKQYPVAFARYYLWLNTKNYFIPHLEKFGSYNIGMDSVFVEAKEWFQLKDNKVAVASADLQQHIFFFYPVVFMMLNLYFAGVFLYLLFSRKLKHITYPLYQLLLLTNIFLLINFCFSVFATPIVLRYQVFPMILLSGFSLWLTEQLDHYSKNISTR